MNDDQAVSALSALAQEDRLAAFRLLVKAGPEGLASGEMAERLGIAPTRMSFHLAALERAGLTAARREGRRIIYSVSFSRMRSLLAFLSEDCCAGHPEICGVSELTSKRTTEPMTTTIYHNPNCGTSRNTLAMLREAGEEPTVIEYLKTPYTRPDLVDLIGRMDIAVRDLLRQKGTPYDELGLGDDKWSDDELIDFMVAHPILVNRPIVVTERGAALCRPSEKVLELMPEGAIKSFVKEDGEIVTGAVSE